VKVNQVKLALWTALASILILLAWAGRASGGKPAKNVAYKYSATASGLVEYGIVLALLILIAKPEWWRFALRKPRGFGVTIRWALVALIAVYVTNAIVSLYSNPGREQGLTPTRWEPSHAGAFVAFFILVAVVAPVVEELMYRGLGFSVLQPFGSMVACGLVGLAFGLAHGVIDGLPVLVVFGAALAVLRWKSDSIYPGMAVHSVFNAIALVLSVTGHG
jgi:membrane protease YdiL (CAAX protease family)